MTRHDVDTLHTDELVRMALAGHDDSFTVLYWRYRPRLQSIVQRRFPAIQQDAEGIAHEALSRAFQQLHQFDARYRFSTWLYTIAFRLASDGQRQRIQRANHHALVEEPASPGAMGPASAAQSRDETQNLWSQARRVLTEPQYTALYLRYVEELSLREIAQAMGRTQVGIRVLLHRARGRLVEHCTAIDSRSRDAANVSVPSGGNFR